ncbi:DUF817 domain-containing protein [Caulobacter sp. D4A]|uniref:DUF817 domain-containing protein n=1 Tax=unclassified Caulobacter TaxID=2648921 RepID=UPI000D735ADA|nr:MULTISPECIES: DUF817 domain-containing protein [unclassified Caulobacter]PXA74386.1 DUF817 domain-containing protein [Caulobacter sp. D4A]PXA88079.1 DUF817 domain-containing protein [Caulobacter sp. D5]
MDLKSRIKGGVAALDRWARPWAERSKANARAYEFLLFGLKQAWACLFGGLMLALLVGTFLFWPKDAALARYDFLVIASVAIQAALLLLKLERWDEAAVILIFHLVGTAMEIFKTAHGSWVYPEDSVLRIGDVPLFTGFMYACVGSYIARAWRLFDFTFVKYPPFWSAHILAVLVYVNFFTHHYVTDIRLGLFVLSAVLFGRTWIVYTPDRQARRMPLLLGLMLVALFIWFAENLGAVAGAWIYPSQAGGWHMVAIEKLGAWYLLMLISFVLVSLVHRPLDACVERLREGIRAAA